MKNTKEPFYHALVFNQRYEQIAIQAASETGLQINEYLQRVVENHLDRIEPTQDTSEKRYEFNPPE